MIYTNDLNKAMQNKCIIFADDTTIYTTGHDMQTLFNNMNEDLIQLSDWFKINKLSLNIGTTNYMIFTLKQTTGHDELKLQIDNTQVQRVHSTKFVGIHIDSKLQWQEHVKHVKKKLSSGLCALNSSKNNLMKTL